MKPVVVLVFLFIFLNEMHAQELNFAQRTRLAVGASFTEAYYLGVQYRIKQSELALNAGSYLDFDRTTSRNYFVSVSPTFYQHLWGKSKKTDLKPWYLKVAATGTSYSYHPTTTSNQRGKVLYTKLHLGRDFNITKRLGFTISAGAYTELYRKSNFADASYRGNHHITFPSIDLGLYYQLKRI
jgi:hypothetical protein